MMMDKLDMSLDDIREKSGGRGNTQKGGRGRGRGRGGQRVQQNDDDDEGGMPSGYQNPLSRENSVLPDSGPQRGGGPERRQRNRNRDTPYARNNARNVDDDWKRDGGVSAAPRAIATGARKILVTNLDSEVNEDDLEEIFENVGAIKEVVINTDNSGRSKGTAHVTFQKAANAAKAVKEYDAAEVDGRPMYLRLMGGGADGGVTVNMRPQPRSPPLRASPPSSGKAAMFGSAMNDAGSYSSMYNNNNNNNSNGGRRAPRGGRAGGAPRRQSGGGGGGGGGARRGRGRGKGRGSTGRGGGGGKGKRGPAPTQENLDAEMDAYHAQNNSPSTSTTQPAKAASGIDGQPNSMEVEA